MGPTREFDWDTEGGVEILELVTAVNKAIQRG